MKKEEVRPQRFLDLIQKKPKEGEMEFNVRKLCKIEELRLASSTESRPACRGQCLQSAGGHPAVAVDGSRDRHKGDSE